VTLYTLVNNVWLNNAYNFYAISGSSCEATNISPAPNTALSGSSQLFSWRASASPNCGTVDYWVDAGTAATENYYYQSGNLGTATSTTVSNLPTDGSTVVITLWSLVDGSWLSTSYNYTAQ
jgi:hypothetical protein